MKVYDELVARGLIAQVTNEAEIREMVDNGKATFYIGFDPTADSLHVGHFMALCLMKRLQMAGNQPIALIGGGTAMIGDPSGRTDMRSMMTKETIEHNCQCFKKQMERFIEFGPGKAQMVNNAGKWPELWSRFSQGRSWRIGSSSRWTAEFTPLTPRSADVSPDLPMWETRPVRSQR